MAKICFWLIENMFTVLITACDNFRAGAVEQLRTHTILGWGGELNVDSRLDLILIVESTVILRKSCRSVDRFFVSKTCRL